MITIRTAYAVALAGLVSVVSLDAPNAHSVRRHRVVLTTAPHFVFSNPETAAAVAGAGFIGGYAQTGILGASTADPYRSPSYGYDVGGYYGPGYSYFRD